MKLKIFKGNGKSIFQNLPFKLPLNSKKFYLEIKLESITMYMMISRKKVEKKVQVESTIRTSFAESSMSN